VHMPTARLGQACAFRGFRACMNRQGRFPC